MARTLKKNTATTNESTVDVVDIDSTKSTVKTVENKTPVKATSKTKKKFDPTDVIVCESITAGELIMIGSKSGEVYRWSNVGDTTEVEYRDLASAVRSASDYITKPYFLIKDDDFLAEFPKIVDGYNSLYSSKDLKEILRDLSVSEMRNRIITLPDGAKNAIRNLASTMVQNGQLDSVNKIKAIDEIFDTKLMLITGLIEE